MILRPSGFFASMIVTPRDTFPGVTRKRRCIFKFSNQAFTSFAVTESHTLFAHLSTFAVSTPFDLQRPFSQSLLLRLLSTSITWTPVNSQRKSLAADPQTLPTSLDPNLCAPSDALLHLYQQNDGPSHA